jgi:hypothetical protein
MTGAGDEAGNNLQDNHCHLDHGGVLGHGGHVEYVLSVVLLQTTLDFSSDIQTMYV